MLRASNARASGVSSLTVPYSADDAIAMHHIYSGWAMWFFTRDPEKTEYCFSKCLEINPWHSNSLYLRSLSKRDVARFESALQDALSAARLHKHKPRYDFEVCECYGRLKNFEKCKAELHNNIRKYHGANAIKFQHAMDVVDEYLKDCLGASLEHFIRKYEKHFPIVLEAIKEKETLDMRPRWKQLLEQGKCDVRSIDEKERIRISPLEKARRERWYRIFNQIYFGRNWIDKVFLRDLLKNDRLLPAYFLESTPLLKELIEPQNEAVKKFVKILHARSPLYVEQHKRFGSPKIAKRHTEGYAYAQQYQTRRKMFNVLQTIREYRKAGNIDAMSKYIESVMGDYVTLKTNRIMPRKFEFLNEVYNTLGLTYIDLYTTSYSGGGTKFSYTRNGLQKMLGIPIEKKTKSTGFVFGNRATYVPVDAVNPKLEQYKIFLSRMEKRLYFAVYPIEKAYIWHEIGRAHFKQGRYEECNSAARHALEASKACNSVLWTFLNHMLIVRSNAAQYKIEYAQEALVDASESAVALKNPDLKSFVDKAYVLASEEVFNKRSSSSIGLIRRKWYGSSTSQVLTVFDSSHHRTPIPSLNDTSSGSSSSDELNDVE